MIEPELLKILCCPETHQPVALADEAIITQLNSSISKKKLKNRGGSDVGEPIEGGLIRKDGKFLYPIRNDIPVMLIDEAIPIETSP